MWALVLKTALSVLFVPPLVVILTPFTGQPVNGTIDNGAELEEAQMVSI